VWFEIIGPYRKCANYRHRPRYSRAGPPGEAAWVRALEKAKGNGNNPNGRWIDSPCGSTLVRSNRHRPQRDQDQTLLGRYAMKRARSRAGRFALCIDNAEYPASLETRKLYEVLPDNEAASRRQLRIVDESGEDYLYPARYFRLVTLPVTLPPSLDRVLRRRASRPADRRRTRPVAIRPA
jgi:hypothetical protein